ncbi:MAG: bifunctional DNA-formamidopyrimidine glycosylase/DNA-(apurinic or apyrimidinic site) lyase [Piscirickettsiaceae bacterium]|jgi:formamidopyrimidine-DNA glycosylase|nr:bifunctional DNA-formamidopyrimidine glycosylase/DNA-(apurinic or apyrimidinic site) lyase [Piscirickettsiaceae bacterium]
MPELPEVETTRKGIQPYLEKATITHVIVRNHSLRWPIDTELAEILTRQTIHTVKRRAKYLLIQCDTGTLMIHLGMSGSLRILEKIEQRNPEKHDHVDITLDNGYLLRYTDPRRFGAILWTDKAIKEHKLIAHLGPEPLLKGFDAEYLYQQAQTKRCSVKTFIMNGQIVVGVGNIYANESLFLSKIYPKTIAQNLTKRQCKELSEQIKSVLNKAIKAGGTSLKDFTKSDGKPGYFAQQLNVYGRKDEACLRCGNKIEHYKETQRATYYCPSCQPSNGTN